MALLTGCTSLLYFPNAYRYVDEKALDHPPAEVELAAGGQTDLLNWYFEPDRSQRLPVSIIFVHGNGQNISAHFRSLYWILSEGISFFAVEFPGYGPNGGTPSPNSTVESVYAAIDWIKKNRPNDAIFVFGQSLGGNVALRTLSEHKEIPICGAAVEGTFLSYKKIAQKAMSRSWLLWPLQWLPYLVLNDSRAIAKNVDGLPNGRYLVIHGDNDQTVPFEFGKELFERLPSSKIFWRIEGGRHMDTFLRHKEYRAKFVDFVKSNCLTK